MSKLFAFFLVGLFVLPSAKSATVIGLSDVVSRVSNSNYLVHENALRAYQAKTNIEKARGDLLPKLNLWKIAGIFLNPVSYFNPASIVESIPDIAPFLVPANWFRFEQVKLLYLAEKEGYRALWGNELHIAKTLYKHVLFDTQLLTHVRTSIRDLEKVHVIVKTKETFGGAKPGSARDVEIRILGLREDEQNIELLLEEEFRQLTYLLGYPVTETVTLKPVTIPEIEKLKPISAADYEFRMLSSSPERRQFDHFISVLNQIKKEFQFSFLGGSEISRGVAGGIFENLPTSNGAGLGTAPAIRIVDAEKEVMKTRKLGVEETLKRQLQVVALQYNSDLLNYSNFKKRIQLSRESKESIIRRLELGENLDVLELSEASRNEIQAETALYAVQYRVMNSYDRLERLIFSGDYSLSPPLIESLKKTGGKP